MRFGAGRFDDWCVYLVRKEHRAYAPRDTEYFAFLKTVSEAGVTASGHTIYDSFVAIYERTGKKIDPDLIRTIQQESAKFSGHADEVEVWLTVIYAGMVAEENKAFSRLGKRIKRLGVHQVLKQGIEPSVAAIWSKGKKWPEIAQECEKQGF